MKYLIFIILIGLSSCSQFSKRCDTREQESLVILKSRISAGSIAITKDGEDYDVVYKDRTEKYFMRCYKYPELQSIVYNEKLN